MRPRRGRVGTAPDASLFTPCPAFPPVSASLGATLGGRARQPRSLPGSLRGIAAPYSPGARRSLRTTRHSRSRILCSPTPTMAWEPVPARVPCWARGFDPVRESERGRVPARVRGRIPASGLGLRGLGLLAPLSGGRLGLVLLAGCGPRVALVNVLAGSLLTLRRFGRCPLLRVVVVGDDLGAVGPGDDAGSGSDVVAVAGQDEATMEAASVLPASARLELCGCVS